MIPLPPETVCALCGDGQCQDDACPYAAHEPADADLALAETLRALGVKLPVRED